VGFVRSAPLVATTLLVRSAPLTLVTRLLDLFPGAAGVALPTRPMFDVALPAASHLGRVVSAAVQKTLMVFDVAAAPLIDALVEACPDVDTAVRLCELAPDWPWLDHAPLIRRGLFSGRCLALLFTSLPPAVLRVLEQLLSDLA